MLDGAVLSLSRSIAVVGLLSRVLKGPSGAGLFGIFCFELFGYKEI